MGHDLACQTIVLFERVLVPATELSAAAETGNPEFPIQVSGNLQA